MSTTFIQNKTKPVGQCFIHCFIGVLENKPQFSMLLSVYLLHVITLEKSKFFILINTYAIGLQFDRLNIYSQFYTLVSQKPDNAIIFPSALDRATMTYLTYVTCNPLENQCSDNE